MGSSRSSKIPIQVKKDEEALASNPAILVLGQLGAPFGVRGWLKVQSFTEPPVALLDYHPWYLLRESGWEIAEIEGSRPHGNGLIVKLKGCETPEAGRCLGQMRIGIEQTQLPPLAPDEYYWADLIGLTVMNEQGVVLGQLDYLIETGANDVIAIKDDKGQEHLLPFVTGRVIKKVDLTHKVIIVDWDVEF